MIGPFKKYFWTVTFIELSYPISLFSYYTDLRESNWIQHTTYNHSASLAKRAPTKSFAFEKFCSSKYDWFERVETEMGRTHWLTDWLKLKPNWHWLTDGEDQTWMLALLHRPQTCPPPLQLERVRPLNSASHANWLQTKSSRSFIRVDVLVTLSLYLPTISLYDFKLPFAYNFKPRLMKRMFDILCCSESLSKNIWRHQNHFACSGWKYARYVLTVGR